MTRDLAPFWITVIAMALVGGLAWLGSRLLGF
jgi:hypothetical protein